MVVYFPDDTRQQQQQQQNYNETEEEEVLIKRLLDNSRLTDSSSMSPPPETSNSSPETKDPSSSSLEQQQQQRQQEEEDQAASEELARQLMAEEAMASYARSVQFLRDHADHFSQEDMAALFAALEEDQGRGEEEYHDDDEAEGEEESVELSYDTLLRLGEQLGNVKEERWSMKSQEFIDQLPFHWYSSNTATSTNGTNSTAAGKEDDKDSLEINKCLICLHTYEHGDCLRTLPCNHMFHRDCIDPWLSTKDACPYCRQSII
jgi:hypothetical protein